VKDWLLDEQPDVLALQETKVKDEEFPENIFEEIGYGVIFYGQPSYNGVAIAYKKSSYETPTQILNNIPSHNDNQSRLNAGLFKHKTTGELIRIICIYVPNGSEIGSEKFSYKLNWFKSLLKMIEEEKKLFDKICILGDFNIAPNDIDVHDPEKWQDKILCSPAERLLFQQLLEKDFFDSFRFVYETSKSFSWWDYRQASFRRNIGLRIDHVILSNSLKSSLIEAGISTKPRKLEKPSDHAPCWVKLKLQNI
jgi:exodeoxyribonuclease-3